MFKSEKVWTSSNANLYLGQEVWGWVKSYFKKMNAGMGSPQDVFL